MKVIIYKNTKIYVTCPAQVATGGPELLHQLVYHLRSDLNSDAYMYYIPNNIKNPVPSEYQHYANPFVQEIEDLRENVIIVPEIQSHIMLLNNYKNIRKIIWFLSVDNFYLSMLLADKSFFLSLRVINKLWKILRGEPIFDIERIIYTKFKSFDFIDFPKEARMVDFYFVQSHYALRHLINKGISQDKIFYLSDYLNKTFLETSVDISKKEDFVAYNPKKGFSFSREIIKKARDIKFVPIINMTRQQVIEILKKAKVYIDFGPHPGKDRIPREAAILGCCVITGKRGSAAFFEDVPIPDSYKFYDKEENILAIVQKIKDCFENFEDRYKEFEYYRNVIRQEPQKFIEDLKKIFVREENDI